MVKACQKGVRKANEIKIKAGETSGDHFGSWFPFFPYLVVTTLYCSDIVWSKDLSTYFFCFLPIFDREFFFFFCFLPIFDQEFLFFFCFLSIFDRELSLFWRRVNSSIVNDLFFLGDPIVPSFEGRDGNSHLGSRFMVV